MRNPCTPQMIAILALTAGFEFDIERCELLAPQLDWLLSQSDLLTELGLETEEPVLVLRPETAVSPAGGGPKHG